MKAGATFQFVCRVLPSVSLLALFCMEAFLISTSDAE